MDSLIYFSMAVLVTYVLRMVKRFGVPPSLSETYYYLQHYDRTGYKFTLALFGMVWPLMPVFIEKSDANTQWLAWLACAALTFVAAAPEFRKDFDHKIHVSATVISALCSQTWVAVFMPWLLLLWIFPIVGVGYRAIDNIRRNARDEREASHPIYWRRPLLFHTNVLFWLEMTAFCITYLALFFYFPV